MKLVVDRSKISRVRTVDTTWHHVIYTSRPEGVRWSVLCHPDIWLARLVDATAPWHGTSSWVREWWTACLPAPIYTPKDGVSCVRGCRGGRWRTAGTVRRGRIEYRCRDPPRTFLPSPPASSPWLQAPGSSYGRYGSYRCTCTSASPSVTHASPAPAWRSSRRLAGWPS
jgi:hypothetical protein